jgi:hypothetical protein
MYHAPKQGKVFKQIIDEWLENNADAFDQMKQKLAEAQTDEQVEDADEIEDESIELTQKSFLDKFHPHERPFLELALHRNPVIATVEAAIEKMLQELQELMESPEHREHVNSIQTSSKQANLTYIRRRIKKDIRCRTHPQFEHWLEKESDENVLFHLTLMMSLKLYNREEAYVRYRILWDRGYWKPWRKNL